MNVIHGQNSNPVIFTSPWKGRSMMEVIQIPSPYPSRKGRGY